MKKTKLHLEPPPRSGKMSLCGDPKPDGLTGLPDFATCRKCLKLCKFSKRKREELSEIARNFRLCEAVGRLIEAEGKTKGAKRAKS